MDDDLFLRWHLGGSTFSSWRVGEAVAVATPRSDGIGCVALGDPASIPAAVAAAASDLRADGVDEVRLSLPPGVQAPAVERVGEVSHWEWMWTDRLSAGGSDDVAWLPDAGPAVGELTALLAHSPRAHARPGDEGVRCWAGVRRGGELVAAGALCSSPAGTPHLRAIVTHPSHRGRGLGAGVTAFLTEAGLREAPVVTLGMYADNDVARRVYHRLGYTTSHRWVSSRARLGAPVGPNSPSALRGASAPDHDRESHSSP